MSIETGTRLGPYEVQEPLGRGAMGVVFRAYHQGLKRTAAVKVLQALAPDPNAVQRFRREAQAIARLRHPNILTVFDFGELDGIPYMIVEYASGGSLSDRLGSGRLDPADALTILHGVGSALDYAHGAGVVHRDVKPANVLTSKDGTPILADFGLAKLLESASLMTVSGATTGTPAYMAPEQVMGRAVGPAADRYSLATVAYELLAGEVPFAGMSLMELLYAHVHRVPPEPSSRNPALSPEVDRVLLQGLAKDPAARWPTCATLVDALEAALEPAPGTDPGRPAVADPPAAARQARPRPGLWRAGIAAGVAALLLLVGLLAFLTWPKPSLRVDDTDVAAGRAVGISARHLPPDTSGRVVMESVPVDLGGFTSDKRGEVRMQVLVPLRAEAGNHTLLVCWNGTCPASATLHVHRP